jgi:hypothetical protein
MRDLHIPVKQQVTDGFLYKNLPVLYRTLYKSSVVYSKIYRGTVFSDYVKEAVICHFYEDERQNADFERRKEEFEELKDQVYKMRVWLIENGMPDE